MRKFTFVTWSIVEYPKNSEFFELQGKYIDTYDNDDSIVTSIPYDFHSFDIQSKMGKSHPNGKQLRNRLTPIVLTEYYLGDFVPTKHVDNEAMALEIIKEWTEKPNDSTRFKRGPVLSPCSCDDEE